MSKTVYIIATIILIGFTFYSGYLFYFASCDKIRDFPVATYVPNRCIK
jgi:hypothetical protein